MSTPQLKLVTRERPQLSDKDVARLIAGVFESDLARAYTSGIRFFVQNGEVTVRGLINNAADQQLVLFILKQISGVRKVINRTRTVRARVYYMSSRRAA